ncbi:MAG: Crp/Fnr family transcriptional regulator [Balneolaceae bacterium]
MNFIPTSDSKTLYIDQMETLSALGISKKYEAGETIVMEHAKVQSIPFIKSGSIKVIKSDDDYKEIVLYYLTTGETCVMSFLAGLNNDTSKVKAIAEEPCEIIFVSIDAIRNKIQEHPEWLTYFFQIYHKRFEELLNVVNDIAFKKMDERLLNLLQQRVKLAQTNTLSITHEQLAQELGTAREVVSRLLKQMERNQLVRLARNQITLM